MRVFHRVRWDSVFSLSPPSSDFTSHLISCHPNTQCVLVNVLWSFPLSPGSENSFAQWVCLRRCLSREKGWRRQIFKYWPWLQAGGRLVLPGRINIITAEPVVVVLLLLYWYALLPAGLLGILLHKTTLTLINFIDQSTHTLLSIWLKVHYFNAPLVRSAIIIEHLRGVCL